MAEQQSDRVTRREVLAASLAVETLRERTRQLGMMNRPMNADEALSSAAEYLVRADQLRRAENAYHALFARWDGNDDPTPPIPHSTAA